jgi:hypothetical protein
LLIPLGRSEDAALQAQLSKGEELLTPSCTPHVSSDHKIGDEAKHISVTVSVTCLGIAYAAREVDAHATQLITSDATSKFGIHYARIGDIQVIILQGRGFSPRQGIVRVVVLIAGTWVYQITASQQGQLRKLIVGKTKQQAIATLLTFPGIAGAQITVNGGNQTLPHDLKAIRILLQYRAI